MPGLVVGAVALVMRAAPRLYLATIGLQVLGALTLLAELLVSKDLLHLLLERPIPSFGHFVGYLVVLAVAAALGVFTTTSQIEVQALLTERISRYATNQVIEVANAVDLLTFEQPQFHNRLLRAHVNASVRPYQMAIGLTGLAGSLFAVGGIGIALLVLQPLFLLLVAVAFTPAWLATARASKLLYAFGVDQTERDRRRTYFFALLCRREEAGELRAFSLGRHLQRKHDDLYQQKIVELAGLVRRRLLSGLAGSAASSVLTSATIAVLVLFVTDGRISVASAGVAAGAVLLLSSRLASLASSAGTLYESSLFIDDFNSFVAARPQVEAARGTAPAPEAPGEITVGGVSFTYPSRTAPSLQDVNLTIGGGQVVALVGENGSGKTTLAKLLAGLYHPTAGTVRWDGVDLSEIDPGSLREGCAVILQDFIRFHLTVRENIGMGRHQRLDDLDGIVTAAREVGADSFVEQLPQGYDSPLGVEFQGGHELSLGQWQRLALARTFFRDAPLVILDEPTSSLDARAEYELFQDTRTLFRGRTVVLVSHRFGNVRLADHIFVLRHGRIVEDGTHDALLAAGGHYAELFRLQSSGLGLDGGQASVVDR